MNQDLVPTSYPRLYAVIAQIPRGKVATYGQIAALAGLPRRARLVGQALRHLPAGSKLPWHRVVNAQGRISPRGLEGNDDWQRVLLEDEGIVFDTNNRIDLVLFGWGG